MTLKQQILDILRSKHYNDFAGEYEYSNEEQAEMIVNLFHFWGDGTLELKPIRKRKK